VAILDADLEALSMTPERIQELAEVFETYAESVSYFFARRGFSPEDCRGLTQETFLKAYRGLSAFRDDAQMRTWVLKIAGNVWKNALRSRKAVKRSAFKTVSCDTSGPGAEVLDVADPGSGASGSFKSPLKDVLEDESRKMLRRAIAELPPGMRRCVVLRINQGLKYREIAAMLQVSVDTVKTQLHHARKRLRDELGEYFSLGDDDS
jgi:RNA polymerase sigma-70 factor (ECF subfamily)